jgi:hypothetical protein
VFIHGKYAGYVPAEEFFMFEQYQPGKARKFYQI